MVPALDCPIILNCRFPVFVIITSIQSLAMQAPVIIITSILTFGLQVPCHYNHHYNPVIWTDALLNKYIWIFTFTLAGCASDLRGISHKHRRSLNVFLYTSECTSRLHVVKLQGRYNPCYAM